MCEHVPGSQYSRRILRGDKLLGADMCTLVSLLNPAQSYPRKILKFEISCIYAKGALKNIPIFKYIEEDCNLEVCWGSN